MMAPSCTVSAASADQPSMSMPMLESSLRASPSVMPTVSQESYASAGTAATICGLIPPARQTGHRQQNARSSKR